MPALSLCDADDETRVVVSTERVPADWLLPYVHQRYDDLSVLGKKG